MGEFEEYTKALSINSKPSTPLWPQGNAVVESFMKSNIRLLPECKKSKKVVNKHNMAKRNLPKNINKLLN